MADDVKMHPAGSAVSRKRVKTPKGYQKRATTSTAKTVTVTLDRYGRIPSYLMPRMALPEIKRYQAIQFWQKETLDDYTAVSTYAVMNNIAQGVGPTQRVGDTIFVKMIKFRGNVIGSGGTQINNCCIALVEDLEPAAGTPGFNDVFQGGAIDAGGYLNPIMNDDKRSRFKLRRLLRFNLGWKSAVQAVGGGSILATPDNQFFDITCKVNKKVKYNDNAAAPYSGSNFYLIGWSDLTSNTPRVDCGVQVWYSDA